jgi:glucan endo-1,3-alpha-glucosidase
MTSYYATAFKTGSYPTVTKDQIFLWARPHPKDANSGDSVGKPTTWETVRLVSFARFARTKTTLQTLDAVWALVLATADGTVTLSTTNSDAKTFDVKAGANKLSIPISAGGGMSATLTRNGATVASVKPDFTFNGSPPNYNYNAFVAYSQ